MDKPGWLHIKIFHWIMPTVTFVDYLIQWACSVSHSAWQSSSTSQSPFWERWTCTVFFFFSVHPLWNTWSQSWCLRERMFLPDIRPEKASGGKRRPENAASVLCDISASAHILCLCPVTLLVAVSHLACLSILMPSLSWEGQDSLGGHIGKIPVEPKFSLPWWPTEAWPLVPLLG